MSRRSFVTGAATLGIALAGPSAVARAQSVPAFATSSALPRIESRVDGPLRIVTSTSILADLARQIGGERVDVSSILPANADPHDFEPAPDDVVAIEDADLIVLHGLQLDTWADRLVEAAGSSTPMLIATEGIETIGGEAHHEDEDHAEDHTNGDDADDDHAEGDDHDFSDGDPHVWFDPMRAKQMVANIRDGLVAADPDGAPGYAARFDAYAAELDQLDTQIQQRIDLIPEDRRVLVTNHDALAYYADRYGLTIVGTVIPGLDSRTEPSAQEVAALIDTINEHGVMVIFAENTVSPGLAEALAADAGIRVAPDLYTDSLGDDDSGADTYIGLMQTNTVIIVENLQSE